MDGATGPKLVNVVFFCLFHCYRFTSYWWIKIKGIPQDIASTTKRSCIFIRPRRRYSASGLLIQVELRARSVCLSVDNERKLWKNGLLDRDAVLVRWAQGAKCQMGSRYATENGNANIRAQCERPLSHARLNDDFPSHCVYTSRPAVFSPQLAKPPGTSQRNNRILSTVVSVSSIPVRMGELNLQDWKMTE